MQILMTIVSTTVSVLFNVVSAVLYIPDYLLSNYWTFEMAVPSAIADPLVKNPESDRGMVSGIATMLIALVWYCVGVAFVDSWLGMAVVYICIRITIFCSPGHFSHYAHTEGHKYWVGGAYTWGNIPVHDYLWFIHGYGPAWFTVEHPKVHHVYHVMHPLDPDYIYDVPRNSLSSFMWFNLKSMFNNTMGLGVLRIYFFHPEMFTPVIRREVQRSYVVAMFTAGLIWLLNPYMFFCAIWALVSNNTDLNINTWVQHAFLNHDNGDCNPWNATILTFEQDGEGEHVKHHLLPVASQEEFVGWFQTPEAKKFRAQYGFHVFNVEGLTLFWAIIFSDYEELVKWWMPLDESDPHVPDDLKSTFKKELEALFVPASWLKKIENKTK